MKNKKGFTLLELLVVVLIIGILAAIALPQYKKVVAKAELAQLITAVQTLKKAQERYFLTNDKYADNLKFLDIDIKNFSCVTSVYNNKPQVHCNNKNFVIWSDGSSTECAAKTNLENSPLSNACKDFTGGVGLSCSTCSSCSLLGLKPCYVYQTYKNII